MYYYKGGDEIEKDQQYLPVKQDQSQINLAELKIIGDSIKKYIKDPHISKDEGTILISYAYESIEMPCEDLGVFFIDRYYKQCLY